MVTAADSANPLANLCKVHARHPSKPFGPDVVLLGKRQLAKSKASSGKRLKDLRRCCNSHAPRTWFIPRSTCSGACQDRSSVATLRPARLMLENRLCLSAAIQTQLVQAIALNIRERLSSVRNLRSCKKYADPVRMLESTPEVKLFEKTLATFRLTLVTNNW